MGHIQSGIYKMWDIQEVEITRDGTHTAWDIEIGETHAELDTLGMAHVYVQGVGHTGFNTGGVRYRCGI